MASVYMNAVKFLMTRERKENMAWRGSECMDDVVCGVSSIGCRRLVSHQEQFIRHDIHVLPM
jgi:hypothetical protein